MWRELVGTVSQFAGASGTVTLPAGAIVTHVMAHSTAGGTVSILGGSNVPIIANAAPLVLMFCDDLFQANTNSSSIVFTGTDSYFVRCVKAGTT